MIKTIVKSCPTLYSLYMVLKNRKNDAFVSYLHGYYDNPDIVLIKESAYGAKQPICKIESWNQDEGFFAGLRWALDGVFFCKTHGMIPHVSFNEKTLYKDVRFSQEINPFDYYFVQKKGCDMDDDSEHAIAIYGARNAYSAEKNNKHGVSYITSKEYVRKLSTVFGRDIDFNSTIKKEIDNYRMDKGIDEDALGVHIRGTDYRVGYKNHPLFVDANEYFPYIDKAINSKEFSKIYLATDDQVLLDAFVKRYGRQLLIFNEKIERGTGKQGIHTINNSGYQNALDVILDMAAMAYCGGIVSGTSQVAMFSRVYRLSIGKRYRLNKTIIKGINKTGKTYKNK